MNKLNNDIITVGDEVQLTKDLIGTVRFVGEVLQRKGIYYGIELTEPKGKTNGTVSNIRYFKCKNKRGLFLRASRISRVFPKKSSSHSYRIGINETIQISMNKYKSIGNIKYIGTPPKSNGIYYGIQFTKPVGDSNGSYHGVRFFNANENCAYFIKANSKRITYPVPKIMQVQMNHQNQNQHQHQKQQQKIINLQCSID